MELNIKKKALMLPLIIKLVHQYEFEVEELYFIYGQEEYTKDYKKVKKQFKRQLKKTFKKWQ